MKIKLFNLSAIIEALNQIIEKDIPIKLSYKLSKLYKTLAAEFQQYEESRIQLINKYGEKKDGELDIKQDGTATIKADNMPKFQQELNDLANIEAEVSFTPINIEELESAGIKIAAKYLMALEDFVAGE